MLEDLTELHVGDESFLCPFNLTTDYPGVVRRAKLDHLENLLHVVQRNLPVRLVFIFENPLCVKFLDPLAFENLVNDRVGVDLVCLS